MPKDLKSRSLQSTCTVAVLEAFRLKPRQSQSSNRAKHKITGEVLAASAILVHPTHPRLGRPYGSEDYELWRCPNCNVRIFPRAWDGKQRYEKTPYFTAFPSKHEENCKPEHRDRTSPTQGRDPRTPTELVSHLILTPVSRSLVIAKPSLLPGEASISPPHSADDHHARSERHIAPACEDLTSGWPGVLDALLRIDRSPSQPYRHWFVRLGTGGPEILSTKRIFFGELRFSALRDIDWASSGSIRIPLQSFVDGRQRHLFIDVGGWTEACVVDLRKQLTEVMRTGQAVWRRQPDLPYVFFLTEEADLWQTDYHVRSEACVFAKLCTVPDLGREGRRYPPRTRDGGDLWGEWLDRQETCPGQEKPVSEPPPASETALSYPAAAFTQDASHADSDADGKAGSPVVSPAPDGNLLELMEPARESASPVAEAGEVVQESLVPEQAAAPSVLPGTQRPSTPLPLRPTAQLPMPWHRRALTRIMEVLRGKPDLPPAAPPTIPGASI